MVFRPVAFSLVGGFKLGCLLWFRYFFFASDVSCGDLPERQSNHKRGARLVPPLECAAEHFDALAHAPQSVTLERCKALSVIGDLKPAQAILLLQSQAAGTSIGVAHNIGHRFSHCEREYTFLQG